MNGAEKWTSLVQKFCASGKSQRVWCLEQGLKRSSLRYWLERLDEISEGEEVIFAEIEIGGEKSC